MTDPHLSGRPADAQDPYFFHSYGHVPAHPGAPRGPDERQQSFHDLLSQFVMQLSTHPGTSPVGFLDRRMPLGGEWRKHLKEALATCRVFMPVYSQRYATSRWCGMEWDAFARRQEVHQRFAPYTVSPIVPVLWTPPARVTLPDVVLPYQYHHQDLGDDYRRMGLLGLMEAGKWPSYRRTVWRIAERVVDVATTARWRPCDASLFDDLHNVFAPGDQEDT
ncbi:TIR-like protein FxsC [Streptomyces sp. NPDC058914]|uniref:TIR-like protein FxsC n=1 Tax=Streptomyces sp. NPDC058914 TaxID=3346671 RepID=UPI00367B9561